MSMLFESEEMAKAEAFVAECKRRYSLNGQTFDSDEASKEQHSFPWVLDPPIVHIDRVEDPEPGELAEMQSLYGLDPMEKKTKVEEIARKYYETLNDDFEATQIAYSCAAERKIRQLAEAFGGAFVGT
jgi:hypothetical protein